MGTTSSKPSGASPPPHVWKGSAPTSISQDVAEQLQASPETDASRAQLNELHVQARVASELRKLEAAEDSHLSLLFAELADAPDPSAETDDPNAKTRQSVSRQVEAVRAKFEAHKKVRELPGTVEEARSEVVRCLRDNDRRPLDCWREVERFKEEVRRLEKGWVDKVVS